MTAPRKADDDGLGQVDQPERMRDRLPAPLRSLAKSVYYPLYRAAVRLRCQWAGLGDERFRQRHGLTALAPAHLRYRVGGTPSAESFLRVGRQTVENLEACLSAAGAPLAGFHSILDFGCGCGRTVLPLAEKYPGKELHGADVDREAITWCRQRLPSARFELNQPSPPLPYAAGRFDLVYAVSVFTHLGPELEQAWLAELHRVLRPGGVALLTVYAEAVWRRLPPQTVRRIEQEGVLVLESRKLEGIFPAWYQTCFRTEAYTREAFGQHFEVLCYAPEGMGTLDAIVLQRN